MPQRIQRKRTKGWRMPEGAIYVGRPTVFGNPAVIDNPPAGPWRTAGGTWRIWAGDVGPLIETTRTLAAARAAAVVHFRRWLDSEHGIVARGLAGPETHAYRDQHDRLLARLPELRGRDLACWCPLDQPCHADVLLALANGRR